jgi:hypothetical protein
MIRHELVAFPGCTVAGLSAAPGMAIQDESSGTCWLHHAPGRWLLWEKEFVVAGETLPVLGSATVGAADRGSGLATAEAAVAAGTAALFDVDGKYQGFAFDGEGGRAVLASTVNLEVVVPTGRDCAAVALFDCPAVLVRTSSGYFAWVTASCVPDFTAALARARGILADR